MKIEDIARYALTHELDAYVARDEPLKLYRALERKKLDITYPEVLQAMRLARRDPLVASVRQLALI